MTSRRPSLGNVSNADPVAATLLLPGRRPTVGRARRRSADPVASTVEPPPLQPLLSLIGSFGAIVSLKQLGEAERPLRRRLSRLERNGLVARATLYDPSRLGQPVTCISLVKLGEHTHFAIVDFEANCRSDAAVTAACRVLGRFDYQISTSHTDVQAAEAWRKAIEGLDGVAKVEMRFVRPIKGCGVAGVVILN